ncbi:MAG: thiamine pyrophosphate-binding protein [Syntrophales bacterium]|nr:thiamine pyrophosphate-binding protein [Syntrophales bacterium]
MGLVALRVADYIVMTLAERGVRHVFMLTGGGAMFLNDAFAKERSITTVFMHHEQACAMAAEGYARIAGSWGVVNVTTGPGGINALNGVYGAWTDSIPLLVISGQVKRETCMSCCNTPGLRQLGDQEVDIVSMVRGITKHAIMVTDPEMIRYHLEKALFLASTGRPGPCWLDIPIDVQAAEVDADMLFPYDETQDAPSWDINTIKDQCRTVMDLLETSRRPVILAGTGVRLGGATDVFDRIIRKLGIPVTTAWTHDLIDSNDPLFCGRPGSIGTRAGNFTVQNADLLMVLGSRLNIRQISYNWASFAREAYKIQVDVDLAELNKPTVKPHLGIHCDVRVFLEVLEEEIEQRGFRREKYADWLAWCRERGRRYPPVLPKHREFRGFINPYHFIECLFDVLEADDIVVTANGAACVVTFQAATIKRGQRLFSNSGSASMGYELPAAVGAALAGGGRRVICLAGDGSIQLNLQELATIKGRELPIKIFVLNNNGYLSIRSTQMNFFGRLFGESTASGLHFPDIIRVAKAYDLHTIRLDNPDFSVKMKAFLNADGPGLCEVVLDPAQGFEPRLSSRTLSDGRIVTTPLEDMFPFLDAVELKENMLIKPWS